MVRHCADTGVPVFGVCLGMQSMAVAYGGVVGRAPELLHGKTSPVPHEGTGVFAGLPSPFTATRYHSLAAEPATVPAELEVTARTEDGIIMGLRHRELPVEGVQFHPESVLTEHGHRMLANWLVRVRRRGRRRAVGGARAGGGQGRGVTAVRPEHEYDPLTDPLPPGGARSPWFRCRQPGARRVSPRTRSPIPGRTGEPAPGP